MKDFLRNVSVHLCLCNGSQWESMLRMNLSQTVLTEYCGRTRAFDFLSHKNVFALKSSKSVGAC